MQGPRWNAADDSVGGDVVRDDCIGADGGVVTDGDASENGDSAPNPNLLAENDGLSGVAGVAQLLAYDARVIGVTDAGVLADHAASADADACHGDEMHAARENNIAA
jgi:hypothetical protein